MNQQKLLGCMYDGEDSCSFFHLAPLFFYGLCFLLGIALRLYFHFVDFLIIGWLLLLWKSRFLSGSAFILIGFLYAAMGVTLPSLPKDGIEGKGVFKPETISYVQSPFGSSIMTQGVLETFITTSQTWKNIPCQLYIPENKPRPAGNHCWIVEGRLAPKTFPLYVLKLTDATPDTSTVTLAEWRFQMKDKIRRFFSSLFPQRKEVSAFLLSMVTGEIDDRLMALQFNRLGLLHLLGVSGFQFSMLASFLRSFLRLFLPAKAGNCILMILLSAYAFTLGNSPPIQRAWIGFVLYAIAQLNHLQITPLNTLGAALLWQLVLAPCVLFQLGFQFSFLCTAAIFIVYPSTRDLLTRWLPERFFSLIKNLSMLDRVGHAVIFFCREALALNCAIHLVSLPLIFCHFHKFPFLSLIYNLFFPVVISVAYLFLIPGLALAPLSALLAFPFLKIADYLTHLTLTVAAYPPALFDFQWRIPHLTIGWTVISLALLFTFFQKRGRLLDHVGW